MFHNERKGYITKINYFFNPQKVRVQDSVKNDKTLFLFTSAFQSASFQVVFNISLEPIEFRAYLESHKTKNTLSKNLIRCTYIQCSFCYCVNGYHWVKFFIIRRIFNQSIHNISYFFSSNRVFLTRFIFILLWRNTVAMFSHASGLWPAEIFLKHFSTN